MSIFEDFKVGDRVRHTGMDERGTVTKIDSEVHVTYDRTSKIGKSDREQACSGSYDHTWFRLHPTFLIRVGR